MDVKGTAFIARRAHLEKRFGEAAFVAFFDEWRESEPGFGAEVLPITVIASAAFMRFNDAVIDHFYAGDVATHWEFGRASAEWALREGPYKAFFQTKKYEQFLRTGPSLWKSYYSEGGFTAELRPNGHQIDAYIDVPAADRHVHFELNVMGYLHRALELTGASVRAHQALKGFTLGDGTVHYVFEIQPDA